MALFGERGYAATSVADIQSACGLSPGSGALYKHFSSKQEVLAEGVRRYVTGLEGVAAGLVDTLPSEPRAAFTAIAQAVVSAMAGDHAVIRVGLRDLEPFPDLLNELWEGLLGALYREMTRWIQQQPFGESALSVQDPAATAAVLVASLTYYRVLEALIGRAPGDVDLHDYLAAWVDSAVATVGGITRR